jgi:hypothetical protein
MLTLPLDIQRIGYPLQCLKFETGRCLTIVASTYILEMPTGTCTGIDRDDSIGNCRLLYGIDLVDRQRPRYLDAVDHATRFHYAPHNHPFDIWNAYRLDCLFAGSCNHRQRSNENEESLN